MTAALKPEPDAGAQGLIGRLEREAARFEARLAQLPEVRWRTVPDFAAKAAAAGSLAIPVTWTNALCEGRDFRHAHVEFFSIPGQIGVLHVCIFPRLDSDRPIFGFDVIAGVKKATGAFLDLSPTTEGSRRLIERWGSLTGASRGIFAEPRTLPDWASVFSPHALAVRPVSEDEVDAACRLARLGLEMVYDFSIRGLDRDRPQAGREDATRDAQAAAQAAYAAAQRRNTHTRRMLSNCVGEALADEFIANWLFPDI